MHVRELFDLTGKVAIVTGGSRGLGLEIAEGLAEAGASVAITGRRRRWLDPAEEQLRAAGHDVLAIEADAAEPEGVRRTIDETVARFGGLDILVNNAGVAWGQPSLEFPLDRWEETLRVNLTGVWLMAQAAAPALIARGGGTIINISSVAGLLGLRADVQDTVAYNASKGGVNALTRDLAVKWVEHGIRVNAVAPGYFRTRLNEALFRDHEDKLDAIAPMGRTGQEDELKGLVVFLASRAASFMTGQVIAIDGGVTAW